MSWDPCTGFLEFNAGMTATVEIAERRGCLVL